MDHILSRYFITGTWFSTLFYFISEYLDADIMFKSIMAMLSLTLLVLQISNQWNIRKERIAKKKETK